MNIAIIGFGNHVKKNIMPALDRIGIVPRYIVVRDLSKVPADNHVFIDDIDIAVNCNEVDAIYIATPVSTHFELTKYCLIHKKNVICEKPITISTYECEVLHELANKNDVSFVQVEMYKFHRAFSYVISLVENKTYGKLISCDFVFKIPHLNKSDIRYNKNLNGGALTDIGFYPISLISNIFKNPILISSFITESKSYDVDLNGIAFFRDNEVFATARWGLGVSYSNFIELEFEEGRVRIERFFSKPETYEVYGILTKLDGKTEKISIGKDDQFKFMFNQYAEDINFNNLGQTMKTIGFIESIRFNAE